MRALILGFAGALALAASVEAAPHARATGRRNLLAGPRMGAFVK